MPEATQNPSLEARAEELVSGQEINADSLAAEAVENLVATPLAQAAADLVTAPEPAAPSPDLAEAVQKLVESPPPAAPAPPVPDKIETLDAQIATLADDLIAGDLADEEGALKGQVAAPPSVPEAVPVSLPPAEPPPPSVRAPAPAVPDLKPAGETSAAVPPPMAPGPATRVRTPESPAKKEEPRKPSRLKAVAMAAAGSMGTAVLAALSGPIRNRPKMVRDLVGWVALVTIFNATCLWMYVLFFRSADAPPAKPAAAVSHDGGHGKEAAKADGHGGSHDSGHGKASAKKDAHGAKKDAHAAKKDDHGGGHGAASKKSTKTAAKKPAKKDSKAQASHGGGH
jgi:hypothetical protein